jgi:hypothetical protein
MNKWLLLIWKGCLTALGAALFTGALAAIPSVATFALGHAPTNMQILYIRLLFGVVIVALIGWLLYFQTLLKLHAIQKHKFLDDYTYDSKLGVFNHKKQDGYFCASCTPKETFSPLKVQENGWQCQIRGCEKFHRNPDYKEPPRERYSGHFGY